MRCDVGGASGHVTIKPSICNWPAFYKSSIYAMKVWCLTLGDLLLLRWDAACSRKPLGAEQLAPTAREKSAEGIVPRITRQAWPEVNVGGKARTVPFTGLK